MFYVDNRREAGGLIGLSLSDVGLPIISNQTGFDTLPGGDITIPFIITLPSNWLNISVSLTSFFEIFIVSGFTPDSSAPGFSLACSTYWETNLTGYISVFGNASGNLNPSCNAVVGFRFIGQAFKSVTPPTNDGVSNTPYSFIYKTGNNFSLIGNFNRND